MEDQEGSQRIMLRSPQASTFFRLGAHNDPVDWSQWGTSNGAALYTTEGFQVQVQAYNFLALGDSTQTTVGLYSCNCLGLNVTFIVGASITTNCAVHTEFAPVWYELRASVRQAEAQKQALIGQVDTLLGQKNTLAESVNELITAKTNTLASKDELTAAKTDVAASVERTYATKSQLTAQKETIAGDYNKAILNKTSTLATKNELTAVKEELVAEGSQVANQLTQMINDKTALTVNVTNITADNVLMAGTFIVL